MWLMGCVSEGQGIEGQITGSTTVTADTGTKTGTDTSTGLTTVNSTGDTGLQTGLQGDVWVFDASQATVDGILGPLVDLSDLGSLAAQRVAPVCGVTVTTPTTSASAEVYRLGQDLADLPLVQDTCVPTHDVDVAVTGSQFLVAVPSLTLVWDVPVQMYNLSIEGEISTDGSTLEDVTVRSLLDTRGLVPLLGGTVSDEVCELLVAFGESCVPCGGGLPDVCYPYSAQGFVAQQAPHLDILVITDQDVAADPTCN